MRTLYPSRLRRGRLQANGSNSPAKRPASHWFSREYLSSVWAKRPAKLLALLCFVGIATLLIYVFAAGSESNTLPLSVGVTNNTNVGADGKVRLNASGVSTAYSWRKGGYDGGGRGMTAAIDTSGAGYSALGGDIWGAHVSTNDGAYWAPTNWGAQGNGQVYMRASAFSLKTPGTVYWGVGTLSGGTGYFGTTPKDSVKLLKTNSTYGFGTSFARATAQGFTPRAIGKLIVVDCDSPCSSNTEYIYALTNKGIVRSIDQGKNFTVLSSPSVFAGAWKAIEKASDGSLYVVNFGSRSTDTSGSGQQMWHITNPRGAASITTVPQPPGLTNDLATINGILWAAASGGVYKLNGSTWQSVAPSLFSISGLTLASIGGAGNTIYVGAGNEPSGSQKWVAKSTDGGSAWAWVTTSGQVSNIVQGTNRTFWLSSVTMPGDAFGIEQLVVDPHNPNFVLMATFRGAYSTTDGGTTWHPSANGLDGSEVTRLAVTSGGKAWDWDDDWGNPSSGKWTCIVTTDYFATVVGTDTGCQTYPPASLSRTVNGATYSVTWNNSLNAYDITKTGSGSIADDYFRGSVDDPRDIAITPEGYIYIANFAGGIIIGTPPGH